MSTLTRPQLAARISTLRSVLDLLWDVTAMTGGDPFHTIGRAKAELTALEMDLFKLDRAAAKGEPIPPEVLLALVTNDPLADALGGIVEDDSPWTAEETAAWEEEQAADAARDAAMDAAEREEAL